MAKLQRWHSSHLSLTHLPRLPCALVQAEKWTCVHFKHQALFFCSKTWCRVPRCPELLVSSVCDWFSICSCFPWPWQFGRVLVFVDIYQMPLNLGLSDVFLMISLGLQVCLCVFFGRPQMWYPCHPSYQGIQNLPLVSWWRYLGHRVKVSARCLHVKVLSFLPILHPLEVSRYAHPTLKGRAD